MEPNYQNAMVLIAQIAQTNRDLLSVDQSIDTIEAKLTAESNAIETTIAYDTRYKNDKQRNLARYTLQQDSAVFLQWSDDLADQKLEKQNLRTRLEENRALLSAMQLEIRRSIVAQEAANLEQIILR